MSVRSLAAKTSATFLVLFVTLLLLPLGEGCNATCSATTDCSGGDVCLYTVGSGCSAQGHCGQREECVAQPTPITLCSCWSGVSLNLFCSPENGVPEPTTNGACPVPDAGGAGDGGASGTDAAASTDAADGGSASDASDSGAITDAGGP
jgi:hypothetical protein